MSFNLSEGGLEIFDNLKLVRPSSLIPTLVVKPVRLGPLITRTTSCLRQLVPVRLGPALPPTRAVPHRDVFYVTHPSRSVDSLVPRHSSVTLTDMTVHLAR